tara:strand:- start:1418 stop:1660 length:243 start_codon:yes stop_codon:yes gene_type:complete
MSKRKRLGPQAKQVLSASDYLIRLLTMEVSPELTDTDLRLMAERINQQCNGIGINPNDTLDFLIEARAEAQAKLHPPGEA